MKSKEELEKYWNGKAQWVLEGKTIVSAAYMTEQEAEDWGWYKRPIIMVLSDGTELILSADDEGNDGGSLFYANDKERDGVLPTL